MSEIKILKLTTSEYLIGKVDVKDNYYIVHDAEYVNIMPMENGRFGSHIFNIDTIISDKNAIEIDKQHVLYSFAPNKEIEGQYLNIVSPISLPPNKQLIL